MEEIWRLLGISGCSTCLVHADDMGTTQSDAALRSMPAAFAAVRSGRAMLLDGGQRGSIGRAKELVRSQGLLPIHLKLWNPFLVLPHVDFDCFPMDRLHGM